MSPQFVKPYIKENKNDYNDAEGICKAVGRPNMRFVTVKGIEQPFTGVHMLFCSPNSASRAVLYFRAAFCATFSLACSNSPFEACFKVMFRA